MAHEEQWQFYVCEIYYVFFKYLLFTFILFFLFALHLFMYSIKREYVFVYYRKSSLSYSYIKYYGQFCYVVF